jgi:hypothetical protein
MVRGSILAAIAVALASCSTDPISTGDGGPSGADGRTGGADAATGAAPVVTKVTWVPQQPCSVGVASPFTVTVTGTPADGLTIHGTFCGQSFSMSPTAITCANDAPASGNSVTVSDAQSRVSDPVSFTVYPCTMGSAP